MFANRRYAPGEHLLRFSGPLTDRTDPIHDTPEGANLLQVGEDRYIYPRPIGLFVNHSCRPNAGLRGTRGLYAIRDIEADEEIRFDYSTTMDEDLWTMECSCGHSNCRGVISDFRTLPVSLREHYMELGIVPRFIVKGLDQWPHGKWHPYLSLNFPQG